MQYVSRKAFVRGVIAGGALVAAPFVWRSGARGAEPTVLKLASIDTPISPNQTICERFAELVEKKTNGAIKLQIFAVGQLGTPQNIMSGLQTGITDFAAPNDCEARHGVRDISYAASFALPCRGRRKPVAR